MVWAYFSFSQWLIIWEGNLPEEIAWYLARINHGWQVPALMLAGLQFALPFLLLLSRSLKRNARQLASVAVLLLAMRFVDVYWLVAPNPMPGPQHSTFTCTGPTSSCRSHCSVSGSRSLPGTSAGGRCW